MTVSLEYGGGEGVLPAPQLAVFHVRRLTRGGGEGASPFACRAYFASAL